MNFIMNLAATEAVPAQGSTWLFPISMVIVLGLMYVMMFLPQKRKEKKLKQMRDDLQVGDEITTIGGIVGRVVSIKDDTVVMETGSDRSKIRIKKWAIQSVETLHDSE